MPALKDQVDDLQSTVDEVRDILEAVYQPEATRAELVTAVSQALDALSDEDGESDDDGDDSDDSDD